MSLFHLLFACWVILRTTLLPNLIIYTKSILFLAFVEKSVDPDQLASEKPADLGLHCF